MARKAVGKTPSGATDVATKGYVDNAILVPSMIYTGGVSLNALGYANAAIEINQSTPQTVTIPANATTPFPTGTIIEIVQIGTGSVTIAGAVGVTIQSAGNLVTTRTQFSSVSIRQRSTDTWLLVGDLA